AEVAALIIDAQSVLMVDVHACPGAEDESVHEHDASLPGGRVPLPTDRVHMPTFGAPSAPLPLREPCPILIIYQGHVALRQRNRQHGAATSEKSSGGPTTIVSG